jgi:hypothetical protein
MTETEIEDMKKELILLRMHKQRLEGDIKKMQEMIKDLMLQDLAKEVADEGRESSESPVGNNT